MVLRGTCPSIEMNIICYVFSLDPTRLLLTFGASMTIQDKYQQNTALHWAILSKNHTAVSTLVMQGANLDIANAQVLKKCNTVSG
jgi:ankyrin repeat protein